MSSDEALLEQTIAGDMRAFDRLYERFERPLFGFIRAQLAGDAAEAEDVLHEAFMSLLRGRGERAEIRSVKAWLFEVARNLCFNRARSRKRAGRALEAVAQVPVEAPAGAESRLEQREIARELEGAVARLPLPLAEVYRLRAAGMSYEEVAHVLDVPLGTVKSRMNEMVKRLRAEVLR